VFLEQIDNAHGEGIVRADDSKIGFLFLGEFQQSGQVFGAQADALDGFVIAGEAFLGHPGVTGRAPHTGEVRRLRQFPNQGVLATARADDQQFHAKE
jgi:hypothetical protein